ncbi:uncharacterized protein LOC131618650 [Vicia villosa]|uniref:uncharacterized protein LOC131618650 n=1 Tax=Vicia villosa TaxID=3911 RepID=UPI00273AC8C6|nr:uncharacterized protein LOC131618650 [Vicia villosa]
MARLVETISNINDGKELWKIAVRIHHRWNVVSNNKEHFEMIFVDKSGDDIHVVANVQAFKASGHKHIIKFTAGTSVGDKDKHDIPPKPIVFTSFSDIITGNFVKDVLLNVIGMVDSIGYAQTNSGAKKQQINMVLRDHINNMVNSTLWESYADQFTRFNKEMVDASLPTIVLLQYAKFKEEGKFPLSVTNTYNVTVLCVDPDFPLMKDFLDKMPKESIVTLSDQLGSNSYLSSHNSKNTQLSPMQKLLSKAVVLPIADIIQLRDITFCATVATTKLLVASPFGWYYRACHMCQSIARGDKAPFECEAGHETMAEIYRYKIEIEVAHGGNSCNFVFWNKECEILLGLSAAQLRDTMIKAGITDPLEFPLALDEKLNMEMAMKVKWHPHWKNCLVVMLIKNDPLSNNLRKIGETMSILIYMTMFNFLHIKESVDEAKTVALEDCEDIEITSEHKPDAVTPGGKRHFPGASTESTTLEGLCDGELSSNKLKKIIKLEKDD